MATPATSLLSRFDRLLPRQMPSRTSLLFTLYTFVLFLVFLVVTFPHDLIARRVAQQISDESGWRVRFDDAWLVPWAGYRFSNVSLLSPDGGRDAWFDAGRLSVRPSLSALVGGGLDAGSFHGDAYGGTFSGSASMGSPGATSLSWEDLQLARYPRLVSLIEGQWSGTLSGDLQLTHGDSLRAIEGSGRVSLRDASLTGGSAKGFTVPDLTSIRASGEFEVKAGRLEIRNLKLTGAEIDADLRGQIYLRAPLPESVVNATLSVKPVPGTPAGIDTLLQMMNRGQKPAGGTYTFTLYGILGQIKVR